MIVIPECNVENNLLQHRTYIKENKFAYTQDIDRLYKSVIPHLRECGVVFRGKLENEYYIKKYVDLIFSCQDRKPFFYIESDLPFCWNSPSKNGWKLNYIKYEWGHLKSINQNGVLSHNLDNLCLQSARCNQHIQSSLNVEELMEYGGKLKSVIEKNMNKREKMFKTNEWIDTKNYFMR